MAEGFPIKVLHVAEVVQGGVATYFNHILPHQGARYGRDNVVLVAPAEHLDSLASATRASVRIISYQRSSRDPLSLLRLARMYWRLLCSFRPSVVHAHCTFAGVICRILPRPPFLVYCPHGWAFDREDASVLPAAYAAIEKLLQSRADRILAISEHDTHSAQRRGIDPPRLQTARFGLAPLAGVLPQDAPREGPLRVLFLGRFDRQKGLPWLLDTVAAMPTGTVLLDVAGKPVLDKWVQKPQWNHPAIRYLGWLSPGEVDAAITACDAIIVPSRWEGLGLVAIEAMRRGVAVLVSNRGALAEVIGHGEAGLVFEYGDTPALQQLLGSVSRDQLRELGRRGQQRFNRQYTASAMNKEIDEIYAAATSERMKPS